MARVLFIECTSTEFNRLVSKDANTIYWLSDTREIFKGDIGYGSNVKFESQIPEFNEAEKNVVYVVNQAGKIQLLVKGDSAMIPAGGEVSKQDVQDAIQAALGDYQGVLADVSSKRAETGDGTVLTFTTKGGTTKEVTVQDLFLSGASYDSATHILSLTVKGQQTPVTVNLEELVPKAVNADQVALARNITATVAVGNIKKGQKIDISSIGSVQALFENMLSQDSNPTTTQPSASITLTGAGAKEVGTEFTPAYATTFNPGAYSNTAEGAQPTNVTATGYQVTDTATHEATTASGSFEKFTVEDATNYSVSVVITHSEGAVPKTFLGKPYEAGKIAAGTKSARSSSVTGFRNGFLGALTNKDGVVNSTMIRGLGTKTNKKVAKGQKYTVQVPAGTQRVIIAYDATVGEIASVTSREEFGSEIKGSFVKQSVQVEGLNKFTAIAYNVYVKDLGKPQATATVYDVTI